MPGPGIALSFPTDSTEWADTNGNGIGDNSESTLIGAWGFEEASGVDILDGSVNGNDGVLGGAALRGANGRFGQALVTDGSSAHVDRTNRSHI